MAKIIRSNNNTSKFLDLDVFNYCLVWRIITILTKDIYWADNGGFVNWNVTSLKVKIELKLLDGAILLRFLT